MNAGRSTSTVALEPPVRRSPRLREARSRWSHAAGLAALATMASCYGAPPSPRPLQDEMHAHLQAVEEARRAAVLGDPAALRSAVRPLYERVGVEGIPAEARPWLADLRRTARSIEVEAEPTEAVRRTALLAAQCGGCHEQLGARATSPTSAPPAGLRGLAAHAAQAGFALDRLWDGVALPSDDAWREGRELLSGSGTFAPITGDARLAPDAVRATAERLEGMAWVAARSGGLDERADVLGDVMVTCAGCHGRIR